MFGEEWEPAEGELIDIRYGGKRGDWSPPFGVLVKMECVPSKKKARFDRNDPAISKKDAGKQQRAAYEAELHADISDPGRHRPDSS
jgi:hypothetical protein